MSGGRGGAVNFSFCPRLPLALSDTAAITPRDKDYPGALAWLRMKTGTAALAQRCKAISSPWSGLAT